MPPGKTLDREEYIEQAYFFRVLRERMAGVRVPVPHREVRARDLEADPVAGLEEVARRPDVLVYTTPPLERDVEVTGPITVTLYAASSATDTDFTAKVDDVYPDGTSMLIEYGIQRARYRESETSPTLIEPGKVYRYTIHVWPTSNLFKAGHRIRLEISSSNFPRFDRNPNTGHPFAKDAQLITARQVVCHDTKHPSRLVLPIIPLKD